MNSGLRKSLSCSARLRRQYVMVTTIVSRHIIWVGLSQVYNRGRPENCEVINNYDFSNFPTAKEFGGFCLIQQKKERRKMKKVLITTGLCVGLTCLAGIADGATKCVALNSSTTCAVTPRDGTLNWSATCTTAGKMVPISGVAGCSSQNGGSMGATADTLTTSDTPAENNHCWCKMISPAISSWVYWGEDTTGLCAKSCTHFCSFNIWQTPSFRAAMFSDLRDYDY